MADEPKVPPAGGGTETPVGEKAGEAGQAKPAEPAVSAAPPTPSTSKPEAADQKPPQPSAEAAPAATPPAAAPPAKPAPPKPAAKAVVKPEPWSSPLVEELQLRFPGAISEAVIFRNQPSITVAKESLVDLCHYLKSAEGGGYTYLTDETAVDYPKREKRFELIYQLYSFEQNVRLRLKVHAAAGERVPSVESVWPTANWLEREVYDMFGVEYEGHPDLRRILLPEDWVGYPLRKDYDILRQDQEWVKANLNIESGQ
jgi:NADH-quinone oxidoreductase subunit C